MRSCEIDLPPLVSVIIPCRNERESIAACLDSILTSNYPANRLEILVADGMSADGTRELLDDYSLRHSNIRLVDNPRRIVSAGLNLAIRAAQGEIVIRMDAHTDYAPDYIEQCVSVLKETGADNVGGPWVARGNGYIGCAIALAFQSPFAVGGARGHNIQYEGEVDTVYLGCWRRELFDRIGLFDEELVRNQDDELNLRIVRRGGKIWQSSLIRAWYQPRSSLTALFRQYSQYGYWKVRVIQKHKQPASWRHLIPGAWLASLICLTAMTPLSTGSLWLLSICLAFYGVATLIATYSICQRAEHFKFMPIMPIVFLMYHSGYGYGFLRGMLDFTVLRKGARESFQKITRDGVPGQDGGKA
jgi:glycosyltransferase involved in cell wall biosynthesis